MLIHHFGGAEGLRVAVVREVEERQREALADLVPDASMPLGEAMRLWWRHISDPALWANERLFFELYGQALQGRPGTTELLDGIVDAWLEPAAEPRRLRRRRAARGGAARDRRHPRAAARPARHRRPRGGRRRDGGPHHVAHPGRVRSGHPPR